MDTIIGAFSGNEVWIYSALGLFATWQLIRFYAAWQELRSAAFGMERSIAQTKLNQAATFLVLALLMAVAEFTLVAFIAPTLPGALPLPTPTLNLLATAPLSQTAAPQGTVVGGQPSAATAQPTAGAGEQSGCVPGSVEIAYPKNGAQISGVVDITGTVDIPNLGFYKYEIARPGDTVWLSINAGEKVVKKGSLGNWITTVLPPGDYFLRLMVADNQGKFLLPCTIQVTVVAPPSSP